MREEKDLYEIMSAIYEKHSNEARVTPAWLATEAMIELDSKHASPPLVAKAAHLQLRQIARSFCRKRFVDEPTDQNELFPDLQTRYPTARSSNDEEAEYALLETLSDEDVTFNVSRLRAEARAKLAHADALEAWSANRKKSA